MAQAYEVIVTEDGRQERDVAIAAASQYLAYCDNTDTFGFWGDIFDVNVYGGTLREDGPEDYGIGLVFAVPLPFDDELKEFMDEMTLLPRVEVVERVSVEMEA